MPKLEVGWRLRKAIRKIDEDKILDSYKNLLQHLLNHLDESGRLPVGFQGAQVIELYRDIMKLTGADQKVIKKEVSALESWLASQNKGVDEDSDSISED